MISETKKIEINLKRLITSCEKIITEDDKVNVINGDGELKPIVIDNTYTVEKYIPIMLSLFRQLEEKYSEQTKQLQLQQQLQQQQSQSPFQIAKQVVQSASLSSPLSSTAINLLNTTATIATTPTKLSSLSTSSPLQSPTSNISAIASAGASNSTTTTASSSPSTSSLSSSIPASSLTSAPSSSTSSILPTTSGLTPSKNNNIEDLDEYKLTKEVLNEYSRKIDVIVGLVYKGESPISNKPSIIRLQASNLTHNKKMNEIHTVMKTRNKQEQKKIDMLLPQNSLANGSSGGNSSGSSSSSSSSSSSGFRNTNKEILSPTIKYRNKFQNTNSELKSLLGNSKNGNKLLNQLNDGDEDDIDEDSFEKRTKEQRKLQDSFAMELLDFSKNLKNHSYSMSNKLKEEDKKIDELNQLMTSSSSKIDRQNQNLKDYTSRSTRDTLNYCLIIVLVLIMFIITYIVIKFSNKS